MNLPDGRVEVLACGSEDAVRTFGEWLWVGSSGSKVTAVEASAAAPSQLPKDFGTG